ncbi:putative membrane protein [Mycobacterium xenopi 3993]|nr:putative membrane protein [Mycobacterium xenopi 3993]
MLIGIALTGQQTALTVLLFTSLAIAIDVQVLADPLAGLLDRMAFWRSPALRADRATLRRTEAALPLRAADPLDDVDDDTFARLTRRALAHYGDLSKLVASPLTALPIIGERLAARGAPDQPLERANELRALLAEHIARLKPRDGGDFGTTEQWRHYNSLYFPYVVGVRAYAQNATAAGLDPTARQAWQWLVTEVPQRSLHNWQNAAARLIAADLRGRVPVGDRI